MDIWPKLVIIIRTILYLLPFVVGIIIFVSTYENGKFRGIITYGVHWLIILFGWFIDKWIGLFFISLPLFILYYYFLSHVAMVVVPSSDPGDWREWRKRIFYFLFYVWGVQYPGWAVTGSTARNIETRIKGDAYNQSTTPGLVWANSHQVVGLTAGITFSRVEAPGTVFTKPFERPFEGVVDLRTQLRTFWIDVVSSDGIPFKALLFTSFAVDREKWNREIFMRLLKEDRLLKRCERT